MNSACRHERRAALAERWLRVNADELDVSAKLNLLKTISDATDSRDKCLDRLKLDTPTSDPWASAIDVTPRLDAGDAAERDASGAGDTEAVQADADATDVADTAEQDT